MASSLPLASLYCPFISCLRPSSRLLMSNSCNALSCYSLGVTNRTQGLGFKVQRKFKLGNAKWMQHKASYLGQLPQNGLHVSQAVTSLDPWTKAKTWVVFSDLHFSRRTCDTCLEVLQSVHAEANARDAGIIFLGDFWHSRGALPVELLNMVIAELRTWCCPAIFIPGNHDQVSFGGSTHALVVLEAINPQIKVFDEPTEFLGALWLPYRRDHSLLKKELEQHSAVKAIFAHLDVVGAFMNESFQAEEGVEPCIFPQDVPVFTGHYHKPHIVQNTLIEYIGSSYQVSSSERDQSKRFLLLNSNWEKLGDISIDVGSRHFLISQLKDSSFGKLEDLRSGDRVRLQLSTDTLEESVKSEMELLQTRGIQVEVIFPIVSSRPRIEQAEHLDVVGLFDLYVEKVGMSAGAASLGKSMLCNMGLPANLIQRSQVHLLLQNVEIEGFGPYLEPVNFPLARRGIRVICGKNMDSAGADSNGTGKSTLVMAPLWVLTGSTDPRPGSMKGLTSSDVVNQRAKVARVRIEGTVNEKPFLVERSVGRKTTLKFLFNGEDCTCQDVKLTQARIDDLIDTSVLQRIAFHGQYGIGGLLEASDKDFKEELSCVVSMKVWLTAKEQSLIDMRSKQTEFEHIRGELLQLDQQKQHLGVKVEEAKHRVQEWEENRARRYERAKLEVNKASESLHQAGVRCKGCFLSVKETFLNWQCVAQKLEHALSAEMDIWQSKCLTKNKEVLHPHHESLLKRATELSVEIKNQRALVTHKQSKVTSLKKNLLDLEVCDKCLQPIDTMFSSQKILQLEDDVAEGKSALEALLKDHRASEEELQSIGEAIAEQAQKQEMGIRKHKENMNSLQVQVKIVRESLASAQAVMKSANQFLNSADFVHSDESQGAVGTVDIRFDRFTLLDLLQEKAKSFQTLISELESEIEKVQVATSKVLQLNGDVYTASQTENPFIAESEALLSLLNEVEVQKKEKQMLHDSLFQQIGWLKELDDAFGHKGIQSYIFEESLLELQERASRYLEALSGGTLGLLLRPSKELRQSKASIERIDKIAIVRLSNGTIEHRNLRQLSGGERRRLALALTLGYAEFASQRTGLTCDFLVLDEVLQHLDSEGKARVAAVLKGLPQRTILVVSQTHSDVTDSFDVVDMVIKRNDTATVQISSR
ncbi:hypothetical protein O6H91_07G051300 [Diphasiastrum complanatum]|uniref:Uncharacterized protein n=1 Tax=Diphasiastrum complanatum TaxID=34168 RepID=A0ACC2D5I2_DIPCM|nr:hypothetical protein O6H91_07G051300 [Diphasiastrum complanatum]